VYVLAGWLLFMRQGALVAQRFDPLKRALSEDLVLVADFLALVGQTSLRPCLLFGVDDWTSGLSNRGGSTNATNVARSLG
jgi:hypothetical protein